MAKVDFSKWKPFALEAIMVFVGVFAAFLLDDWRESKALADRQRQIYAAVQKDLLRYVSAGEDEKSGFVTGFQKNEKVISELIAKQELSRQMVLFGDYWHIEIIDSMLKSGMLSDIDIDTFSRISRFHSIHQNMLMMIQRFNDFYENNVTANYGVDGSGLYDPESGELSSRYISVQDYSHRICRFAELTVELAAEIADEIETKHLAD